MHIRKLLPYLLLAALIAAAVWQAVQINGIKKDTQALAVSVDALRGEQEALRETIETQRTELSQIVSEPSLEPTFEPDPEIALEPNLQEHTYNLCQQSGVPYEVMLAIMDHESRFITDVPDNINVNGTRDRGLCQINEVNWGWLADQYGLDVSDLYDNIEAAVVILSAHLNKYPLEQALACYAAGESGMLAGGGMWFAEDILGE